VIRIGVQVIFITFYPRINKTARRRSNESTIPSFSIIIHILVISEGRYKKSMKEDHFLKSSSPQEISSFEEISNNGDRAEDGDWSGNLWDTKKRRGTEYERDYFLKSSSSQEYSKNFAPNLS